MGGTPLRWPKSWRAVAPIALGVLAVVASGCLPLAPPPPTVVVYGDSLTTQSAAYVNSAIGAQRPGLRVVIRSFGGTALCDWLPYMQSDGGLGAKVVVIQFTGNTVTPCASGTPPDTPEWVAKNTRDAQSAAALWTSRGAKVLFVGNPRGVCDSPPHALDAAYQSVAAQYGATFSDAPEQSLAVDLPAPASPTTTTTTSSSTTSTTATTTNSQSSTSSSAATGATAQPEPVVRAASAWPCSPNPPRRVWAFEMPCLPDESPAQGCGQYDRGLIAVRDGTPSDPGGHLCPVNPGGGPCPVYSSGVRRFGGAIANAVVALTS